MNCGLVLVQAPDETNVKRGGRGIDSYWAGGFAILDPPTEGTPRAIPSYRKWSMGLIGSRTSCVVEINICGPWVEFAARYG